MQSSTMPNPAPPYSSGMWMPGSARSSLNWPHPAGSSPSAVAMRRRPSVVGDRSFRNRRTADRNCSCSSVKANWMRRLGSTLDSSEVLIDTGLMPRIDERRQSASASAWSAEHMAFCRYESTGRAYLTSVLLDLHAVGAACEWGPRQRGSCVLHQFRRFERFAGKQLYRSLHCVS